MVTHPFVSVVVPCYNEEQFIAACLDSILSFEYPAERIEFLVVDGDSSDATKVIALAYADQHSNLRVLNNPKKVLAAGWNVGIKEARGDIILTLIGHGTYRSDYVAKCVRYLEEYGADCVGGVITTKPQSGAVMARAIALAMSHRFGVGGSAFRTGTDRPIWDTNIHAAAWKRQAFDKVGLYNEDLIRSQDADFQARFRRAGGRALLVPDSFTNYYPRGTYRAFAMYSIENGFWISFPLEYGSLLPAPRRWVPMVFVLSLLVSSAIAPFHWLGRAFLIASAGSYALLNLLVSSSVARKKKDLRLGLALPIVFGTLHVGYGVGCLAGLARVVCGRRFRSRVASHFDRRVTSRV